MKKTSRSKRTATSERDLEAEYIFDYSTAKPNRFAGRAQPGSVAVLLDPDVARVYNDAASVNTVLRALMKTMPQRAVR
jgi:hypothetical protein